MVALGYRGYIGFRGLGLGVRVVEGYIRVYRGM